MKRACFQDKCPESAGIAVRFVQESLSGISRNQCPLYARTTVRNGQESVSGLLKNMHYLINWTIEDKAEGSLSDNDLFNQFRNVEKLPADKKRLVKEFLDAFLFKYNIQQQIAS